MKKIKIYFLIIGIICVVIGGLGSAFYVKQIRETERQTKVTDYQLSEQEKSDSIHLKLTGDSLLTVSTAKTDTIKMITTTSLYPTTNTMDVKKTNQTLTIDMQLMQQSQDGFTINFSFLSNPNITELIIPDNVKQLTIDGDFDGQLNIDDTAIDNLSIHLENTALNLSAITVKQLTANTEDSILISDNSQADQIDLTTNYGSIDLVDSHATQWNISSKSGYTFLTNLTGEIQINSSDGEIRAENIKDSLYVKNKNSDFYLYGSTIPKKLDVTSLYGSIDIILDELLDNINITAKSKYGSTIIYGEEQENYQEGEGQFVFDLSTDSGNIYIE